MSRPAMELDAKEPRTPFQPAPKPLHDELLVVPDDSKPELSDATHLAPEYVHFDWSDVLRSGAGR
eukprot:CAMPEP_0205819936 /NCGR_PEP_ID=MMETSP0206-20130828/2466_1 /ASSEMBLY_ACC=CAM_ASM_000279 /TAXON_ID=36767 /ORGANISM="Euplotes focardii, Strain TN1" /LENGTH=64 /DNA_ID=CAMNT_0053114087 /DNA_START=29 /DNA_END=223 /DNA_ORIENTATION=-